jgi:hypothetical protein
MHAALTSLIDLLEGREMCGTGVISWGAPVPVFGDLMRARIATLGLNPSNREFVDEGGNELQGLRRRFHTLKSLGLKSWCDLDATHLQLILATCREYFLRNPYDQWFKKLDRIVCESGSSYYSQTSPACHLDLIPYATARKWTDLSTRQRSKLLRISAHTLALLLRDSPIQVLILNGKRVVEEFQVATGINLEKREMRSWSLPRQKERSVAGFAYEGSINAICGVKLIRQIGVLGFNHNIQSSFGVTRDVVASIGNWVAGAFEHEVA